MLLRQMQKFRVKEQRFRISCAVKQPNLRSAVVLRFVHQPVDHGSDGRNPRARGQEDVVFRRLMQNKNALRFGEADLLAFTKRTKIIPGRSLFPRLQAKFKTIVLTRRRSNGIYERNNVSIQLGFNPDKLSGQKFQP